MIGGVNIGATVKLAGADHSGDRLGRPGQPRRCALARCGVEHEGVERAPSPDRRRLRGAASASAGASGLATRWANQPGLPAQRTNSFTPCLCQTASHPCLDVTAGRGGSETSILSAPRDASDRWKSPRRLHDEQGADRADFSGHHRLSDDRDLSSLLSHAKRWVGGRLSADGAAACACGGTVRRHAQRRRADKVQHRLQLRWPTPSWCAECADRVRLARRVDRRRWTPRRSARTTTAGRCLPRPDAATGRDAPTWAQKCSSRAPAKSCDQHGRDGTTRIGFNLPFDPRGQRAVSIPVVPRAALGNLQHLAYDGVLQGPPMRALAAVVCNRSGLMRRCAPDALASASR